ncbi:hypothetical protein K438DRAFT_2006418 [Mycena galopus ATCC 62051]|nr:hypothetical protein K438DRAFT_2006418 [Mycena galopus ATCC 62051]
MTGPAPRPISIIPAVAPPSTRRAAPLPSRPVRAGGSKGRAHTPHAHQPTAPHATLMLVVQLRRRRRALQLPPPHVFPLFVVSSTPGWGASRRIWSRYCSCGRTGTAAPRVRQHASRPCLLLTRGSSLPRLLLFLGVPPVARPHSPPNSTSTPENEDSITPAHKSRSVARRTTRSARALLPSTTPPKVLRATGKALKTPRQHRRPPRHAEIVSSCVRQDGDREAPQVIRAHAIAPVVAAARGWEAYESRCAIRYGAMDYTRRAYSERIAQDRSAPFHQDDPEGGGVMLSHYTSFDVLQWKLASERSD